MPTPRGSLADFPWRSWGAACAAVLLLAEAVKLAWMFSAGPAPLDGDAGLYWKLGEQVARGDVWMTENPLGFRTPGFPWCLAVIQRLSGDHAWWWTIALQHAAVGLTTVLTGWWTYQLTGRMALMNLALLVRVLSFAQAAYAGTVLTEAAFEPCFLVLMILLTRPNDQLSLRVWCVIGVLFALALLIRPATLAVAPAILVAAMGTLPHRAAWRTTAMFTMQRLALVVIVGIVIIGPWCVRNYRVFGQPKPMIFFGRELWMSVYGPASPAGPSLPDTPEAERIRQLSEKFSSPEEWRVNWTVSGALTQTGLNDAQVDAAMETVAWQGLRHTPARWLARCVWRSVDFWRTVFSRELYLYGDTDRRTEIGANQQTWGDATRRSQRARVLDAAPETRLLIIELGSLLGLIGAVGLAFHPHHSRSGIFFAAVFLGFGLVTGLLELPNYRFRMVLEPALIVAGVSGLAALSDLLQRGRHAVRSDSH